MTDVIVLDEADRMIQDGHFKELRDILAHIYTQRLKIKTKRPAAEIEAALPEGDAIDTDQFTVGKEMKVDDEKIDWTKIRDLYDDEEILEDMQKDGIDKEIEKPEQVKGNKRQRKVRDK